jgi:hypothetical protein
MVKPTKGKATLFVCINEDLIKKVKELAIAKYGSLHGALSYAVEEALRRWVWEELRGERGRQLREVWSRVRDHLEGVQKYDLKFTKHVLVEDLEKALRSVLDADEKAVGVWLKAFEDAGVLKKASPKVYEVAIFS